jgi:Tfp pilus assembly protein PilN
MLFATLVLIVSAVLLLPSYLTLKLERSRLINTNDVLTAEIKKQSDKGLSQTLREIRSMSTLAAIDETAIFKAINAALLPRSSAIILNSVNYKRGEEKVKSTLTITGIAAKRTDLTALRDSLKKDAMFTSVELPISNLAKETDVEFTMILSGNF